MDMADDNKNEVRVTIQLKSPRGYAEQDVLAEESAFWRRELLLLSSEERDFWRLSRESLVQGPYITAETCAAINLPEVNVRRDLLITSLSSHCYNVDTFLMNTLPIPTSAVSNYICVMLSSLSLEADRLMHFTTGLYSLVIVDLESEYLHMVAFNLREQQPPTKLLIPSERVIVPYRAPPVGERTFTLGFAVYRQTGYINLDNQEVTRLQTRRFDEFIKMINANNLRMVGDTWLFLGPEVVLLQGPAPAA